MTVIGKEDQMTGTTSRNRPRSWKKRALVAACVFAAIVFALPWLVANTALRNFLIGQVVNEEGVRVTAGEADFGWWSPLRLRDVNVAGDIPQVSLQIHEINFERSWLATWLGLPGLGQVTVDSPTVEVVLPDKPLALPPRKPAKPIEGRFVARGIEFRAVLPNDPDPVILLDRFDVVANIEPTGSGRFLTIEPVKLLDRAALSPKLRDHGLQLVAPLLAETTTIDGSVSLELTTFHVPLDGDNPGIGNKAAEVRGKFQLHHVTAGMKDSAIQHAMLAAMRLLRVDVPQTMTVADNTEVAFHLHGGRVYHDGLTFLFPEVSSDLVWKTHGSVGLDETLDLTIDIQVPKVAESESPLLARLTAKPIQIRLGGTVDHPQFQMPEDGGWLNDAALMVLGEGLSGDGQPLSDTMRSLLEQMRQRRDEPSEAGTPALLDRMREQLRPRRGDSDEATPRRPRFNFRKRRQPESPPADEHAADDSPTGTSL